MNMPWLIGRLFAPNNKHSAGAKLSSAEQEAIGRSKGGLSSKIHTFTDALGNPTLFLTSGQASDLDGADVLLPQVQALPVLADKAYDADERVVMLLEDWDIEVVIPPNKKPKDPRFYDSVLYKSRHLIENFFAKLNQ